MAGRPWLSASIGLFWTPVVRLLDRASDVLLRPGTVAELLRRRTTRDRYAAALGFGATALSLSVVFYGVAFRLLGVSSLDEFSFWAFNLVLIGCMSAIMGGMSWVFRLVPASSAIAATVHSMTASWLLGAILISGSSATLAALHSLNYIPSFKLDPGTWGNDELWQAGAKNAYYDCLRSHRLLFNVLYNGLGGQFSALRYPIDGLSYVLPATYFVALVTLIRLIRLGGAKRPMLGSAVAVAAAVMVGAALYFGANAYSEHLFTTTECSQSTIDQSLHTSGEAQVDMLVQRWRDKIGTSRNGVTHVGVERQGRSLVLRFSVDPAIVPRSAFEEHVRQLHAGRLRDYCASEWGEYWRKIGISDVWIFRYGDTDSVARTVLNADQCRQ